MPDPINRNTPSSQTPYDRDVNDEMSSQRTSSVSEPAAGLADAELICRAEAEFSDGAELPSAASCRA